MYIEEYVEKFINYSISDTLYPDLYHYTSIEGMIGILSSKCLWLSESTFLNDPEEIKHGISLSRFTILEKLTNDSKDNNSLQSKVLKELNMTCQTENVLDTKSIFIVSFCENGDLLSQWKGYSKFGKGYSLSFQQDMFTNNTQDFLLGKVIYEREKQDAIIKELINCIEKDKNDIESFGIDKYVHLLFSIIQLISSFFKNEYFKEENEWRLVKYVDKDKQEIFLRSSENGIIPYIKWKIKDISEIEQIIIGPKIDFLKEKKTLSYFIDQNRIISSTISLQ